MSKIQFARTIRFSAGHHYELPGFDLEANRALFGAASFPHDHDWALTLWFEGPLDPDTGMLVDLVHVDQVLEAEVLLPFHGQHINDVDPFFKDHLPTTEVLAGFFAQKLQACFPDYRIARLRIAESDDLFAEWFA